MKAKIVLGCGYGDEGKGLTTDYLCSISENPLVVRFSGGQQAGHTVMIGDKKHVHSNFGAGTLRGIPSYFTEHTTIYPLTMARELQALEDKGVNSPTLVIHPLAKITTPFDVFANRSDYNNLSHGTCGLGVGKTMKRSKTPYSLHAVDLSDQDTFLLKLESIARYYENKFNIHTEELSNEMTLFLQAINNLSFKIQDYSYFYNFNTLIFEGSQGILLDMTHGVFPNVTFANTTSKNALEILDNFKIYDREIYYVSRCYHTRHGSGYFKEADLNLKNFEEETNTYNDFQKDFKIGNLNYSLLNQAFNYDKIYHDPTAYIKKNLVITCLDQIEDENNLDYSKISPIFEKYYESRSPYSDNLKLRDE